MSTGKQSMVLEVSVTGREGAPSNPRLNVPGGALAQGRGNGVSLVDHSPTVEPLWPVEDQGPPSLTTQGHTGWVKSVAFSPDGRQLATGSKEDMARVWDLSTLGKQSMVLKVGARRRKE